MLPEINVTRCCGCGQRAKHNVKPCNCPTMVGGYEDEAGVRHYTVLTTREQFERMELSALIKTRLFYVDPDDQDLVLENEDWMRIVAALEGAR